MGGAPGRGKPGAFGGQVGGSWEREWARPPQGPAGSGEWRPLPLVVRASRLIKERLGATACSQEGFSHSVTCGSCNYVLGTLPWELLCPQGSPARGPRDCAGPAAGGAAAPSRIETGMWPLHCPLKVVPSARTEAQGQKLGLHCPPLLWWQRASEPRLLGAGVAVLGLAGPVQGVGGSRVVLVTVSHWPLSPSPRLGVSCDLRCVTQETRVARAVLSQHELRGPVQPHRSGRCGPAGPPSLPLHPG